MLCHCTLTVNVCVRMPHTHIYIYCMENTGARSSHCACDYDRMYLVFISVCVRQALCSATHFYIALATQHHTRPMFECCAFYFLASAHHRRVYMETLRRFIHLLYIKLLLLLFFLYIFDRRFRYKHCDIRRAKCSAYKIIEIMNIYSRE